MILPSLDSLYRGVRSILIRFPVPVVSILSTAIFSIAFLEIEDTPLADTLFRWSFICGLAFVATLLADLACLARQSAKPVRIFVSLLVLAAVLGTAQALFPLVLEGALPSFWYGYWITIFALHLGIALTPLAGSRESKILWGFNLRLFLRFFFSTINAALLFVGLALALGSVEQLFGLSIDEGRYFQIWLFATFAVHPLLLLGGIPSLNDLELAHSYPQPLRFTLQFIALPLVALYLLIIYVYIAKIGVTARWPDGWLALPIFVLSVIGTLAAILSLPLAQTEFWAKLYHRWLYRLLLPLSVVLFLALLVRLGDYGLTINRYLALALALWLFLISLTYVLRPRLHLAWLPGSLLLISLLSVWSGPFNAFACSMRSQLQQIHQITAQAGALEDGVFVPSTSPENVSSEERRQLHSSLSYMMDNYGMDSLETELRDFLQSENGIRFENSYRFGQITSILEFIDLKHHFSEIRSYFSYSGTIPTGGHLWVMPMGSVRTFHSEQPVDRTSTNREKMMTLKFSPVEQVLSVYTEATTFCEISVREWAKDIRNAEQADEKDQLAEPVYWDFTGAGWNFRFVLQNANLTKDEPDAPEIIDYLSGRLFYTPPN